MGSIQRLTLKVEGWGELVSAEPLLDSGSNWVDAIGSPQAIANALSMVGEISEREQPERPWALVMDDGELGDIERALEDLGTPTLRLTGPASANQWRQPKRLLVISDRRALTVGRPIAQEEDHFLTMVVLRKPSRTLFNRLTELGFDYAVRRPVDSEALRLLLRNALYRGGERRARTRFPVGCEVSFRSNWRKRHAVLAELSQSGCSLRMSRVVETGRRIKVHLPDLLTGGGPLALCGAVVRCERLIGKSDAKIVSVMFERRAGTCRSLAATLQELRRGRQLNPGSRLDLAQEP